MSASWHGASDDEKPAELRRLAPDGTVEESLTVKDTTHIAGVESDREGGFWCGFAAGNVLRVRRRTS